MCVCNLFIYLRVFQFGYYVTNLDCWIVGFLDGYAGYFSFFSLLNYHYSCGKFTDTDLLLVYIRYTD